MPHAKASPEDLEWWRDAKFGMFIHWGVYALLGRGEWAMMMEQIDVDEYAKLADQFTAARFDADEWAAVAKDAGMKYMVLTARHHDGFSLWDSPASVNRFDAMHSAARRDFIKEYTEAVRRAGLRVGLYYSPMDWRFPGYFFPNLYRSNALQMKKQTYEQVRELLTKYGPLDVLWWDGGGDDWLAHGGLSWGGEGWHRSPYKRPPIWEPEKLVGMVREIDPHVLMSDRAGIEGDFASEEGGEVSRLDTDRPYERCSTLAGAWGYQEGAEPRSFQNVIHELVTTVVHDGNLLLNVGPMPDGRIHPDQVERLKEVGAWLRQYGDSIYGTRGGPYRPAHWGGSTHRDSAVWLHVTAWPEGALRIDAPAPGILKHVVLTPGDVDLEQTSSGLVLTADATAREEPDTIIRLDLGSLAHS